MPRDEGSLRARAYTDEQLRMEAEVNDTDSEYFQRRAEEEVERAMDATVPEVVAAHYALSELYLQRVNGASAPARGGEAVASRPSRGEEELDVEEGSETMHSQV